MNKAKKLKISTRLPRLPKLLDRKIYKTGQTRGADDDVIYQNRVGRNSTVLIPYSLWKKEFKFPGKSNLFQNGFIVLIPPIDYFETKEIEKELANYKLKIGQNCLVFYETREHWNKYNPEKLKWKPAQNRLPPLKGYYVARVSATTATNGGGKIIHGFTTTTTKGAGIRLYEYADSETIKACRDQLEVLFWLCFDSEEVASKNGMTIEDALLRKVTIMKDCEKQGLLDYENLINSRVVNKKHETTCPLCLDKLSGKGFFTRMQQAVGREVHDFTVTEINLFHIEELKFGIYNHRPYNVGWGHHHCNVVTKDSGISATIEWMKGVLNRNKGYPSL